ARIALRERSSTIEFLMWYRRRRRVISPPILAAPGPCATVERRRMTTTGATDFDIAGLQARRTTKWHKFPPDGSAAWGAGVAFGAATSTPAGGGRLTGERESGLAAPDGFRPAAFARRMERRFGWHTDPADTIAIGDLVQASFSSVITFSEPGDAI